MPVKKNPMVTPKSNIVSLLRRLFMMSRERRWAAKMANGECELCSIKTKEGLAHGERVGANSLRGSSEIAQICDNNIALERFEDEIIKGVKVKLDICRNPLAMTGEAIFQFDKESMRFKDNEPIPEDFKQERGFPF